MAQINTLSNITVRRHTPVLIRPAKPNTRELKLLSDIDDQDGYRHQIRVLMFYRENPKMRNHNPVSVIKEALAKVLVFYYPFAGQLKEGPARKLMVDCNGEGVMFIEADADVTLKQFGEKLLPPFACLDKLVYDVPGSSGILNSPLLLIQEAANILGQIASQAYCRQSIPQTLTPMEIDSRIEKEVTTRVTSHFDSLWVEMEERMQAMNAKQEIMLAELKAKEGSMCIEATAKEKDWFNSRRPKDKKQGIVNRSHSGSDSIQSNELLDSGDGDGDIKSKMINVLMKENKRDEAKCRLLMDQCRHLTKSIEDRKKLIDGIKKIG